MKVLETNEVYHQNPARGSSFYKSIHQKTLLHALLAEKPESPAMVLGGAIHCAILEPERFAKEYVVSQKFDRRTKDGKAAAEAFALEHAGKTVIDSDDMEIIEGMKSAILSHPVAKMMLTNGEAEYSYYSVDEETGLKMKCRPDYHNGGTLIDLKSTADASFEGFAKQIGNLGYHLQAAYYLDVFNASQGTSYNDFHFIAVESKPPFAVAVYRLTPEQIEIGRMAYKRAMATYAEYLKEPNVQDSVRLYGYPVDIVDIQVPYYLLDKVQPA